MVAKVSEKIRATTSVSLTTDIWSADSVSLFHLGVTAHFVMEKDGVLKRGTVILAATPLEGAHTADCTRQYLVGTLEKWQLSAQKVSCVVSVFLGASSTSSRKLFKCYSHLRKSQG